MLTKKQYIDSYIITFPIKEGAYADTYRVKDSDGKNYFLKLIDFAKLHHTQFDDDGHVLEVEIAKHIDTLYAKNVPNVVREFLSANLDNKKSEGRPEAINDR